MPVGCTTSLARLAPLGVVLLLVALAAPARAQINPRVKIVDGSRAGYAPADRSPAPGTNAFEDNGDIFADEDEDTALPLAPAPPRAAAPQADPISTSSSEPWTLATIHQQPLTDEASWHAEPGGGCSDGCCGPGGCPLPTSGGAFPNCRGFGLSAGVEATYLRLTDTEPSDFFEGTSYEAAPRVWLGWQGVNGWGLRGRYWQFDSTQSSDIFDDNLDFYAGVSGSINIELFAADAEITRAFNIGRTEYCAGFGLRSGRLMHRSSQHFSLFDLEFPGADDATFFMVNYDRDFKGTGITTSLGIRRPLLDSRLALICNLRGSAIWGGNDFEARWRFVEVVPVGVGDLDVNDLRNLSAFGSNNRGMWISELQAGGEWSTPISSDYGGGNAVLRLMFEGQWWNLPGVNTTGNFPDGANPSPPGQLYELLGFTAAVAFTR